jgi:diguanylate cyclase (GGDEF)-like protein
VGRYGGEEFLIVLPGSGDSSAMQFAERLREKICAEPVTVAEGSLLITLSVGVAAWQRGVYPTPELLLRTADEALYRAKASGRNRVEWASLTRAAPAALAT